MKVSLVLATKDRKEELKRFFESLKIQSYKDFEVILCDQNKRGFLEDLVRTFEKHFPILHLYTSPGLSHARNIGLREIRGELVAFPDDDCVYPENLLERVVSYFKKEAGFQVLCGRPVNFEGKATAGKFLKRKGFVGMLQAPFTFCSFTIFLKREVVKEIGEFDERLGLGARSPFQSAEDLDYGIRILKKGFKVFYDPELVVFHPEKERVLSEETLKRAYKYALGTGFVLRKHGFPFWYVLYYNSRPLLGVILSLLKGNSLKARWHYYKFLGRWRGWISGLT